MGAFGFLGKLVSTHLYGIQETHPAEQAECALGLWQRFCLPAQASMQLVAQPNLWLSYNSLPSKARQDTAKDPNTPIIMGQRLELYIEGPVKDIQYMLTECSLSV